jgi:PAS domain S-box-containing protein
MVKDGRDFPMDPRDASMAALDDSDALFHTLADLMPSLCWMANGDGWIFWYNSRWYEYTGTTPEQMKGWGWQSVHDPAKLPQVLERWRNSIATGKAFEMTFPLRGADGIFRPFLTRIAPLIGAEGRIVRWLGVNTDITEERRSSEILERLVEERTAALMREAADQRRT